jgi:hypothetical protein
VDDAFPPHVERDSRGNFMIVRPRGGSSLKTHDPKRQIDLTKSEYSIVEADLRHLSQNDVERDSIGTMHHDSMTDTEKSEINYQFIAYTSRAVAV